uniref:Uncharacterized protein n=1 Tax=Clytia hemisphaerica TaxID=252671 RepID=A0A7M5VGH8_9CNID
MGPLSSSLNQCNNLNTISVQLSKIGNVLQAVPPPFGPKKIACSGNGLIQRVHDGCLHDYGMSRSSDHLEVYCYKGAKRFCLSGELCPWRGSQPAQCSAMFALATCSVGGLSSSAMAVTWGQTRSCWRSCSGWWIFRRCRWNCRCSGPRFRVNCNTGSATVSYY